MRIGFGISSAALLLFPALAYGYLDSGSGSYMIQVALALLLGAGFAVRAFWGRIIHRIGELFGKKGRDETVGKNT
jgi:hypothetical protein